MLYQRHGVKIIALFISLLYGCTWAAPLPAPAHTTSLQDSQTQLLIRYSRLSPHDVPTPLSHAWDNRQVDKYLHNQIDSAGMPQSVTVTYTHKKLTLQDAILLALRNNPDVISAKLARITDKYSQEIAANSYAPQFNFGVNETLDSNGNLTNKVKSGIGLTNSLGTNVQVNYSNNLRGDNNGNGSIAITQPLLQGFGLGRLQQADNQDQIILNKMTFADSIQTVISAVEQDYNSLQSAQTTLANNKVTLKNNHEVLFDTNLQYKAGKKALSAKLQSQSNYTQSQLDVVQSQLDLSTSYQALLQELGVSPASHFQIASDLASSVDSLHTKIPALAQCVVTALNHNHSYLKSIIGLRTLQRQIIRDRDQFKWSLSASVGDDFGSNNPGGSTSSFFAKPSAQLALSIPFSTSTNLTNKNTLVSDRITYEMAKINLLHQKESLVNTIIQYYNAVTNKRKSLALAIENINIQKLMFKQNTIQFKFGKLSALAYNTAQTNYQNAQQALVADQKAYFQAISTLYGADGMNLTLQRWHIKLRY